jgi:hypothetical protein
VTFDRLSQVAQRRERGQVWSFDSGHRHGDPVNPIKPGPPVDSSSVVPDLNSSLGGLDGFDEVDVHASGDLRQDDVAHLDKAGINWGNDDLVTAMD